MTDTVHIVDDDAAIRDALAWLFASRGVSVHEWASGEAFLSALPLSDGECVILDVRMDGLSGPETFDRMRAAGCTAPVIFLTGHADVPIAVQTLKAGAFDFVEKPFNDNQIVDAALAALAAGKSRVAGQQERRDIEDRLAGLSPREREVLDLMVEGFLNKQIAERLGIAMRTVEIHRSRVLTKMGARNAVDLTARLSEAKPRDLGVGGRIRT